MVRSSVKEHITGFDEPRVSSSGLTRDFSLSRKRTSKKQQQRKYSRVQIRFSHSARSCLLNEKQLVSRRSYRTLLLKDNVIIRTPPKINWIMEILVRQLALMGQEVDSALFDLECPNTSPRHKVFTPQLAPSYDTLIEIIRIVLPSTTECALARHTFVQLLTHWMFVCHLHLIRGWLVGQPKVRDLIQTKNIALPLERLLLQRHYLGWVLTQPRPTLELMDYRKLKCLDDIVDLKVVHTCDPQLAKNVYSLLFNLLDGQRPFDIPNGLRNSTVLNLLVLIEAEWNAAKRLIDQFRGYLNTVLVENLEPVKLLQLDKKPTSVRALYEEPLEFATATAGLMSLICLLLFMILLANLSKRACCTSFGAQFEISHSDPPSSSIHRVLATYCCLAPICVYLNLELRLWFTNLLINKLNIIYWFMASNRLQIHGSSHLISTAYQIHLNRLNFEIHWSWKTVEHYEHRLQAVCRQLRSELAHWDFPVPVDYA